MNKAIATALPIRSVGDVARGICSGLSGGAFGLCTAYCYAQQCNLGPNRVSCGELRNNLQKLTGTSVFPCDAQALPTSTPTASPSSTPTLPPTETPTPTSTPTSEVAGSLTGLRWELPCTGLVPGYPPGCYCPATFTTSATVGGQPAAQYDVELRFRGVVEQRSYSGGTADGYWYIGGGPAGGSSDSWNIYRLDISDPPQVYFLNAGSSGLTHCFPIDYTRTLRVSTGAVVTLSANSVNAGEIRNIDANGNPIVIPDIPPAPDPFNGQFVQMDVISVTRVQGIWET